MTLKERLIARARERNMHEHYMREAIRDFWDHQIDAADVQEDIDLFYDDILAQLLNAAHCYQEAYRLAVFS